jgi:hypothetical protein
MTQKDKRYIVKVDFYIYAENDKEASEKAIKMNNMIIKKGDVSNRSTILEIGEQPHASFDYREFDLIKPPIENIFKNKLRNKI